MDNWQQLITAGEAAEIEAYLRTTNWGVDIKGNVHSPLMILDLYASTVTGAEGHLNCTLEEYHDYLGARD